MLFTKYSEAFGGRTQKQLDDFFFFLDVYAEKNIPGELNAISAWIEEQEKFWRDKFFKVAKYLAGKNFLGESCAFLADDAKEAHNLLYLAHILAGMGEERLVIEQRVNSPHCMISARLRTLEEKHSPTKRLIECYEAMEKMAGGVVEMDFTVMGCVFEKYKELKTWHQQELDRTAEAKTK